MSAVTLEGTENKETKKASQASRLFTSLSNVVKDGVEDAKLVKRRGFAAAYDKAKLVRQVEQKVVIATKITEGSPEDFDGAVESLENLDKLNADLRDQHEAVFLYLESLKRFEFIKKIDDASSILQEAENARMDHAESLRQAGDSKKLRERLAATNEDALGTKEGKKLLKDLARFFSYEIRYVEGLSANVARIVKAAAYFVEHTAVLAWVVENPDKAHEFIEGTLLCARQGINATARAGDILGYVPEQHAQTASISIKWSMVASKAGMVVVENAAINLSVERQIANYGKENDAGSFYDEHDLKPLLMANMLAKRAEKQVKDALDFAEPIVILIADRVPGLDLAWEKVKETIIRIVSRYQNRRLQLAQDNADENKDSFEFFAEPHKKLWAETKSLLKDDVTAVMNPAKLVLDAQFNMMLQELIDGIMTILPIEPAQRVDGAALRGIIGNLLDVARSHAGEVSDELHDFEACPDRDKDGQRLLVLSKVRDLGDAEKQHYFVSRDGVLGRLYSSDHRFEEAGADDPGAAEFRKVLTTDSLQRPLSEFRADSPVVHRVTGGDARIARIGDVIGEIDLATAVFTPTGPDTRRYEPAVWKTRSIRAWKGVGGEAEKGKASAAAKKGYWQLRNGKPVGELVEGTWHQPFDTPHILIFEPLLGRREWVRAEWETGDPGITVGDALAKLGTALPRYNRL